MSCHCNVMTSHLMVICHGTDIIDILYHSNEVVAGLTIRISQLQPIGSQFLIFRNQPIIFSSHFYVNDCGVINFWRPIGYYFKFSPTNAPIFGATGLQIFFISSPGITLHFVQINLNWTFLNDFTVYHRVLVEKYRRK